MKDLDLIKSKLIDYKCADTYVFSAIDNIELQLKLLEKLQETLYSTELYLVYKHTSPDGKIYIGITKNLPNARWNEGAGYETQKKFYKAIQTFGWINFKHEIIAAGLSENEAKRLESELIIKHRSNEDEFGYNTQVLHSVKKESAKANEKQEKKKNINNTEIATVIIEKFSIKTISGTIYYLKDDKYVIEKEYPVIQKELLLSYQIESRKQKEIIEQIKILSYAKKEDIIILNDNVKKNKNTNASTSDISSFFVSLAFEEKTGFFLSDEELYESYLVWTNQRGLNATSKNEFIKNTPTWMKKYRVDIERVLSTSKIGWEIRSVILEEPSGNVITSKGIKLISDWLENTQETFVCVPMICEKALELNSKRSRKLGNEICFALRNIIPGWKDAGVMRTKEYGNQLCFVRNHN